MITKSSSINSFRAQMLRLNVRLTDKSTVFFPNIKVTAGTDVVSVASWSLKISFSSPRVM